MQKARQIQVSAGYNRLEPTPTCYRCCATFIYTHVGKLPFSLLRMIMRVQSTQRFEQVAQICEKYGLVFIMGIEFQEDLTDLRKAILEMMTPKDLTILSAADSIIGLSGRTMLAKVKHYSEVSKNSGRFHYEK